MFIPPKKSVSENCKDHFILIRKRKRRLTAYSSKKLTTQQKSILHNMEEKTARANPTFTKQLAELSKLIQVEQEYPSSGTVDWEKSFYINLITIVFQYSYTIITAEERPSWDKKNNRKVQAIQYFSYPINPYLTHTPKKSKRSTNKAYFPRSIFQC